MKAMSLLSILRVGGGHRRVCGSHSGLPLPGSLHVNHGETKLRIKDALPKLKNLPKEMGGSGVSIPK